MSGMVRRRPVWCRPTPTAHARQTVPKMYVVSCRLSRTVPFCPMRVSSWNQISIALPAASSGKAAAAAASVPADAAACRHRPLGNHDMVAFGNHPAEVNAAPADDPMKARSGRRAAALSAPASARPTAPGDDHCGAHRSARRAFVVAAVSPVSQGLPIHAAGRRAGRSLQHLGFRQGPPCYPTMSASRPLGRVNPAAECQAS